MKFRSLLVLLVLPLAGCALFRPAPPRYDSTTLANGLVIRDLVVPETGRRVKQGDRVTIHYEGRLEDGKVFDSSYDRGEPITFEVGAGQVPAGLDQGLIGLRLFGRRRLVVPHALGYGPDGVPGIVPGYAKLRFELELMALEDAAGPGSTGPAEAQAQP